MTAFIPNHGPKFCIANGSPMARIPMLNQPRLLGVGFREECDSQEVCVACEVLDDAHETEFAIPERANHAGVTNCLQRTVKNTP